MLMPLVVGFIAARQMSIAKAAVRTISRNRQGKFPVLFCMIIRQCC